MIILSYKSSDRMELWDLWINGHILKISISSNYVIGHAVYNLTHQSTEVHIRKKYNIQLLAKYGQNFSIGSYMSGAS